MSLPADLQEKLGTRPVYYLDRKYLLIKSDKLNHAILSRAKLKSASTTSEAVLGYHGCLSHALEELIRLKSEYKLVDKVYRDGPFANLEEFVKEYIKTTISTTKATSKAVVEE